MGEGARAGAPHQPQTLCPPSRRHTAAHVACPWHSAHTFAPILSLQQEHVGVLGASVHIFPDSLQKEQGAVRTSATPHHAQPLKLVVPVPAEATREASLRSASKSETQQVPSKPIRTDRALCSGLHLRPRGERCSGWTRASAGTSPVITQPPSAFTPRALHPHHLRISGLELWSKDRMKLQTPAQPLGGCAELSAAPPASHQAHGPGRHVAL